VSQRSCKTADTPAPEPLDPRVALNDVPRAEVRRSGYNALTHVQLVSPDMMRAPGCPGGLGRNPSLAAVTSMKPGLRARTLERCPTAAAVADRTGPRALRHARSPHFIRKVESLPQVLTEVAMDVVLGIDVGKADFHCALLVEDHQRSNSFPNSRLGFERLAAWLANRKVTQVHACLESTGGWSEELAAYLHERGHAVSVVNPSTVKAVGQSELSRTKTDKADAALIARYCRAMKPRLREPPSPSQQRLQRLGRRRVALLEMRVQETNRLQGPGIDAVRSSIEATIAFLDRQIEEIESEISTTINEDPTLRGKRELLKSIPGIAEGAATTLFGELPQLSEFRSSKALAAFVGLCPRQFRSGSSVAGSWLSKVGNAHVRRVLYWPAITAMRCNPVLKAFADRLRANGKRPKQIIAAAMRRLLVLAYGVLKSGRSFDPALHA